MNQKIVIGFYILAGSLNLISHIIEAPAIAQTSKVALMPILIYLVFVMARGVVTMPRLLLAAGLVCSWGGDILLLNDSEGFFLGGLGMFLVAQVIYTIVLSRSSFGKLQIKIKALLPILSLGVVLMVVLIPNTGAFTVPVVAYSLCILSMVSAARLRKGHTTDESYRYAFYGAVLFVVSDALIAVNKFTLEIPMASFCIMATYIVAQLLIVKGVMSHPGG